jgi:uncharacterized protein YdaU (DUF1376 family)
MNPYRKGAATISVKAPAFQFYPADFVMGTVDLSAEAVGVYIRLLCYQWEKGSVPTDPDVIARIAGCTSNACASVMHKFRICTDGKSMQNERLEEVRSKQEAFRKSRAKAASIRWKRPDARAMRTVCSPSPPPNNKGIDVEIPDWLKPAWAEWTEARKQAKRRPYTALGAKKQVAALVEMGEARAVAAINYSIRQGYQGIYEESANKPANATDQRPNSRRYASTADYSKVTSHGLDRQLGRVPPEPSGSG